jgi:hypothetical protein
MSMKNNILLALAVSGLFVGTLANAQISLGLKGGANISNLSDFKNFAEFESKAKVGLNLGGFVNFKLGRIINIQPELFYSSQGSKIDELGKNLNLNYINIPVMLRLLSAKGFYVEAGPQLGILAGDVKLDDNNLSDEFKKTDLSAGFGLGYLGNKSPIGLGLRYNVGLGKINEVNISTIDNADVRNGVFQVSLYWRLLSTGILKK